MLFVSSSILIKFSLYVINIINVIPLQVQVQKKIAKNNDFLRDFAILKISLNVI